jgi:ubiquinone/menaquinone biosynthesis C-methylase UbiE
MPGTLFAEARDRSERNHGARQRGTGAADRLGRFLTRPPRQWEKEKMKLNWVEKRFMNTPARAVFQRRELRAMLQLGGDLEGGRVLEIGCGRGVGAEIIFDLFRPSYVEALDYDPDQVRRATQRLAGKYPNNLKIYQASATEIPAEDGEFDAVFDTGALHHIPDNTLALNEIWRVLKPGGFLFFLELLSSRTMSLFMRILTQHPPEAQFTWAEFNEKLAKAHLAPSGHRFFGSGKVVGVAVKEPHEEG